MPLLYRISGYLSIRQQFPVCKIIVPVNGFAAGIKVPLFQGTEQFAVGLPQQLFHFRVCVENRGGNPLVVDLRDGMQHQNPEAVFRGLQQGVMKLLIPVDMLCLGFGLVQLKENVCQFLIPAGEGVRLQNGAADGRSRFPPGWSGAAEA